MKNIYNKKYAESWIKNYESKKDVNRVKNLEPFIKKKINDLKPASKILDVGCGWGMVAKFLKQSHHYYGLDIPKTFLDYIKKIYPHPNLHLKFGKLPDKVDVENSYFDLVIASMVLHVLPSFKKSINLLLKKTKPGGRVIIVDFRDSLDLSYVFTNVIQNDKKAIKGNFLSYSGEKMKAEVYYHREKEIEKFLKQKQLKFKKKYLGIAFVSYEITKD